ncbi:hypothetical protein CcrColossus_gp375 [Caulobacter phage CcrColossus]|uniref:Uncharacterized protein n=1 Tax=Caulobacter phage CcrColossus TaxID=1211640 RepID=K4JV53_9CAUD|nr:hypothetical protein CcrColossus_gp375 [Caulobacter phage CcrColossus]AFU88245.1 hypothetical protein CcrColossus_gp375 [Caulobacter phage CcrColossus]
MTQQIIPRHGNGDWGVKRRLIAALHRPGIYRDDPTSTVMLFIVPGHTMAHGARGFGRDYVQAQLILRAPSRFKMLGGFDTCWLEKGRITQASIAKHADKINEAFGFEIASRLHPSKTLWVNQNGEAI